MVLLNVLKPNISFVSLVFNSPCSFHCWFFDEPKTVIIFLDDDDDDFPWWSIWIQIEQQWEKFYFKEYKSLIQIRILRSILQSKIITALLATSFQMWLLLKSMECSKCGEITNATCIYERLISEDKATVTLA